MSKWNSTYWTDLGERAAASAIGGVLTMVTADATGVVSGDPQQWWVIVGVPTVVSLLKGLLVNLNSTEPSASLADVTSHGVR